MVATGRNQGPLVALWLRLNWLVPLRQQIRRSVMNPQSVAANTILLAGARGHQPRHTEFPLRRWIAAASPAIETQALDSCPPFGGQLLSQNPSVDTASQLRAPPS